MSSNQIDELGRTVANVCTICPGGVVCFFPSYEYEKRVYTRWAESGQLTVIGKRKQVQYISDMYIVSHVCVCVCVLGVP